MARNMDKWSQMRKSEYRKRSESANTDEIAIEDSFEDEPPRETESETVVVDEDEAHDHVKIGRTNETISTFLFCGVCTNMKLITYRRKDEYIFLSEHEPDIMDERKGWFVVTMCLGCRDEKMITDKYGKSHTISKKDRLVDTSIRLIKETASFRLAESIVNGYLQIFAGTNAVTILDVDAIRSESTPEHKFVDINKNEGAFRAVCTYLSGGFI